MTGKQLVVVSFSFGTGLLLVGCFCLLALGIFSQGSNVTNRGFATPRLGPPPNALKEAFEHWQYGPVNKAAQNEVKDGLFSRLRERRQGSFVSTAPCIPPASIAVGSQIHSVCPPKAYSVCPPKAYIDPTDCTYSYYSNLGTIPPSLSYPQTIVSPVYLPTVVPAPPPQLEYPSNPSNPSNPSKPCIDCRDIVTLFGGDRDLSPRNAKGELKTGQYVCSHCRQSCVGSQWHTDWQPDGSPLTFICERCDQRLSIAQKSAVFKSYMAKQSKQSSIGALHPELE